MHYSWKPYDIMYYLGVLQAVNLHPQSCIIMIHYHYVAYNTWNNQWRDSSGWLIIIIGEILFDKTRNILTKLIFHPTYRRISSEWYLIHLIHSKVDQVPFFFFILMPVHIYKHIIYTHKQNIMYTITIWTKVLHAYINHIMQSKYFFLSSYINFCFH